MPHSMVFRVLASSLFAYPEIECSKDPENSPHAENIMEMRYDVVCIVQRNVNSPVCKYNSG
jgi:hypothetical protein